MRLTMKKISTLVPALTLSGLLMSACTTLLPRADANNLTINCKTDEAIAVFREMEAQGGSANMRVVSNNLPGVLMDVGRAAEAHAEIERLAKKITTDGDYDKTRFALGKMMQKTVIEIRNDRELKYGYGICRNTRPELFLSP